MTEMNDTRQSSPTGSKSTDVRTGRKNATNPLYGVKGWLKFFVVLNMYITPVVLGLQLIIGTIGLSMSAEY